MKITIDTDNKTLEIVNEITIQELTKFVEEYKLQNYKIIPTYKIQLSGGSTLVNSTYPYVVPCGNSSQPVDFNYKNF